MNRNNILSAITVVICAVLSTPASGDVINVDFIAVGGTVYDPSVDTDGSGAGDNAPYPGAATTDFWNGFELGPIGAFGGITSGVMNDTAGTATPVTVTHDGGMNIEKGAEGPFAGRLFGNVIDGGHHGTTTFSINNLLPGHPYDVYVYAGYSSWYGGNGGKPAAANVTIDGNTQTTMYGFPIPQTAPFSWVEGDQYLVFSGVVADESGQISGSVTGLSPTLMQWNTHFLNALTIIGSFSNEGLRLTEVSHSPGTDQLTLKWESKTGKLYNLRSETDPAAALPADWPIFGARQDLPSTPPENTLVIPLPADPTRLFVIEEFNAPPVSLVSDDFESGQGNWTTGSDGQGGTAWELGVPSNVGPSNANSPTNCFGTNLSVNYEFNADVWLRSPPIDLTNAAGATLNYVQYFEIELDFDSGTVSLLDASDDSVLAVLVQTVHGSSASWEEVSLSLPAAALGKEVKIEFRLDSDDVENEAGWYIDDFDLTVP